MSREGIAVAGNLIVDHIKQIDALPGRNELARILSCVDSTGGCVCNTGVDLAILDPTLRVKAYGAVGEDAAGELIVSLLKRHAIDTAGVIRRGATSYTDVYAERGTASRTFFQFGGADDALDVDDIDLNTLDVRLFHIGYLLLLGRLDSPDAEHGTRMARLLKRVRERGVLTSVDMVSSASERFAQTVAPSLPHVDYLVVNELEASRATGIPLTDESGALIEPNVPKALRRLIDMGVNRWAIIHAACGAYGLSRDGQEAREPSKRLPVGYIGGTVGAGDAFCAGSLLAAYRDMTLGDALRCGNAAALASLRADTATGSMCPLEEALALYASMD